MSLGAAQNAVTVEYFAALKDSAGKKVETIELLAGDTPMSVYLRLADRYAFQLQIHEIGIAINDEFSNWEVPLKPADKLVFIPPVAGG